MASSMRRDFFSSSVARPPAPADSNLNAAGLPRNSIPAHDQTSKLFMNADICQVTGVGTLRVVTYT